MAWSPASIRHFGAEEITAVVDNATAVRSQRDAFVALASGDAELAPRALLSYGPNTAFGYLARACEDGWPVVKIGSVNPGNAARGLPGVHALVLVMDKATGAVVASADGETVTALRTPAATVAAIDALLPGGSHEPRRIVVVGTGRQGSAHAELARWRFPQAQVRLVPARKPAEVEAAVAVADIVILCTSSFTPVVDAGWLRAGVIVVSIGAFAPDRLELGPDVIRRAGVVYADDAATARRQCGPVVAAVADGVLDAGRVRSIGDVITGRLDPADTDGDITLYVSVGLGVQDAAIVELLMCDGDG